jgi:hypothetical protein
VHTGCESEAVGDSPKQRVELLVLSILQVRRKAPHRERDLCSADAVHPRDSCGGESLAANRWESRWSGACRHLFLDGIGKRVIRIELSLADALLLRFTVSPTRRGRPARSRDGEPEDMHARSAHRVAARGACAAPPPCMRGMICALCSRCSPLARTTTRLLDAYPRGRDRRHRPRAAARSEHQARPGAARDRSMPRARRRDRPGHRAAVAAVYQRSGFARGSHLRAVGGCCPTWLATAAGSPRTRRALSFSPACARRFDGLV